MYQSVCALPQRVSRDCLSKDSQYFVRGLFAFGLCILEKRKEIARTGIKKKLSIITQTHRHTNNINTNNNNKNGKSKSNSKKWTISTGCTPKSSTKKWIENFTTARFYGSKTLEIVSNFFFHPDFCAVLCFLIAMHYYTVVYFCCSLKFSVGFLFFIFFQF